MKYALGNMLNGAGGLNADQLALDLQFAADKTLTARRGPSPILTRGSTGTFVGSNGLIQTAVVNAARFDHDPVTLASRGLLIEEGRTNLFQRSEEFDNSYWTKFQLQPFGSGSIANTTETTAPDGSNNSDKLVENTANDRHQINDSGITATTGTAYTFSVFVKRPAGSAVSHIMISFGGVAGAGLPATSLNLTTLEIGNTLGGSNLNSSAIQYPNGWIHLRCTITTTTAGSLVSNLLFSRNGLFANRVYTGDGTSGIFIWGAQLEAGSFATSYIPTTTSALARSADVCSITDITSFYAGLGTIFSSSQLNGLSGLNGICGFNTGILNHICINRLSLTTRASTFGATPSVSINSAANLPPTTFVKSAFAFNTNDAAYFNNNVLAGTATSFTLPSVTQFQVGANGGQAIQSGTISAIRYYKKRLPNTKLASLTV